MFSAFKQALEARIHKASKDRTTRDVDADPWNLGEYSTREGKQVTMNRLYSLKCAPQVKVERSTPIDLCELSSIAHSGQGVQRHRDQ